jgi:hypothetical protein
VVEEEVWRMAGRSVERREEEEEEKASTSASARKWRWRWRWKWLWLWASGRLGGVGHRGEVARECAGV